MATPHTPTALAKRALTLALGAGISAWLLFVGARLSDVVVTAGLTSEELWGPNAVVIVRPSTYLLFAAIAVFALGGLFGKRLATRALIADPLATLPRAVRGFAGIITIIGLACAALAASFLFLDNFLSPAEGQEVPQRVLSAYLPIVLYTALVVTVILGAFVFAPTAPRPASVSYIDRKSVDPSPEVRRATALAFTLPITAAMVALIFGLIVYDVTQTSLEAWVWVLVQLVIAGGIVAGTVFAARAVRTQLRGQRPEEVRLGASRGSSQLNFALSIVFAVAVGIMSMGYGSSAVDQLRLEPSVSLSISSVINQPTESPDEVRSEDVTVSFYGSDLARGSEVVLALDLAGEVLVSEQVDRHGSVWAEAQLPHDLAPGDYVLNVSAGAADQKAVTAQLPVTVADGGIVEMPNTTYADSPAEPSRLMTPTLGWALGDFAPALVLLLLAVGVLYLVLTERNREAGTNTDPAEPAELRG